MLQLPTSLTSPGLLSPSSQSSVMSTFSGSSHSEKEANASLFVISYMCPEVTLVPVAD